MKTKVEIISLNECKTLNAYGKEPIDKFVDHDSGQFYNSEYLKYQKAENERKVYRIFKYAYPLDEEPKRKNKKLIIGSICEAEIDEKDKTAII